MVNAMLGIRLQTRLILAHRNLPGNRRCHPTIAAGLHVPRQVALGIERQIAQIRQNLQIVAFA
ncbi:MAG TPA: hypothetical protein VF306_04290, partial [Pirellulales bacterium]